MDAKKVASGLNSTSKPSASAILFINSISIPTYSPFVSWYSNGANVISVAITYFLVSALTELVGETRDRRVINRVTRTAPKLNFFMFIHIPPNLPYV